MTDLDVKKQIDSLNAFLSSLPFGRLEERVKKLEDKVKP